MFLRIKKFRSVVHYTFASVGFFNFLKLSTSCYPLDKVKTVEKSLLYFYQLKDDVRINALIITLLIYNSKLKVTETQMDIHFDVSILDFNG